MLSKAQIFKSIPETRQVDQNIYGTLKHVRALYGPNVHYFSKTVAKALASGSTVYGLEGQDFWSAQSKAEKRKQVKKITFWGYHPDFEMGLTSLDDVTLKPGNDIVITVEGFIKEPYSAHYYKNTFSTGSGSDPIFVFLNK